MGFKYNGHTAPISMVLRVAGLSSAAWYDKRPRKKSGDTLKRGPQVVFSDEAVLLAVKDILKAPMFYGEGYKKLKVRLEHQGIKVGKERLLALLKAHDLLAHQRLPKTGGGRKHEGTIIAEQPNMLYACDIKEWRCLSGKFYMFSVIDHYNNEILSHLCCLRATHAEACEVLRLAIKQRFGALTKNICKQIALSFRTDHGSQFTCQFFEQEVEFLGITFSRAFVRSPESNGIIERYHRTIKSQVNHRLAESDYCESFKIIDDFVQDYNEHWLIHRLGLASPIQYRLNNVEQAQAIEN